MPSAAHVSVLALISALAGCYSAPFFPDGEPCDRPQQCPDPQRCVMGRCSLHDAPPVDADPAPRPDAGMPDAPPVDAPPPLPCVATGLGCSAGTATVFQCGTQCWVKCSAAVPRDFASTTCAGWSGALGEIDDATEETCVNAHIATATFWIGAIQGAGATTPADRWTWNGTAQMVYTDWATGKPDDADGVENGAEQCGAIRPGGTWDDDGCTAALPFFCRRPGP